MMPRAPLNLLGVLVHPATYSSATDAILAAAAEPRPLAVAAQPVHGIMTGVLDPVHRYRLNHLDLVVPDGQPVRWALNLLHGAGLRDRVYGPTLMLRLCERAAATGLPIYLYGSRAQTLTALSNRLTARFPGLHIAGSRPGQFRQVTPAEAEALAAGIRATGARIVFVALGCPRQEVWAYENRQRLGVPIVAVGAAFDFHAGTVPQAPPRWQALGLEWAFRLLREPRRLWRRYVFLNPLYLVLVALQWLGWRRVTPASAHRPTRDVNYA